MSPAAAAGKETAGNFRRQRRTLWKNSIFVQIKPRRAQTVPAMKRILSLCLTALLTVFAAQGQGYRYPEVFIDYGIRTDASLDRRGEFSSLELSVAPMLSICRWFDLKLPVGGNIGLFDLNDRRDYSSVLTVGLEAAFNFYNKTGTSDKRTSVGIFAGSGSTVGSNAAKFGANWKYVYYDAGIACVRQVSEYVSLYFGVGYRYYHTYKCDFRDYSGISVSLGVRVGSYEPKRPAEKE